MPATPRTSIVVILYLVTIILCTFLLLIGCAKDQKGQHSDIRPTDTEWSGSQSCAPCHGDIYRSYMQTGMGRSFSIPDIAKLAAIIPPRLDVYEPRTDFHYSIAIKDSKVVIREFRMTGGKVNYEQERIAGYQVGSANNTISFIEEVNGYLFEMPLTWYSKRGIWDMSPGYRENNSRFDRPVNGTCINCHTAPSPVTPQTENHFESVQLGIGCENCHGPGREHVLLALEGRLSKNKLKETIFNPARVDRATQMDICQRCHLEGLSIWNDNVLPHDVQVGKRLQTYKAVFVSSHSHESETEFAIAAQADRLMKSVCYQRSGTMTCITCHDPHQSPREAGPGRFNATCQGCHGTAQHQVMCSRESKENQNCISCHMKVGGTSDIPHVLFTDHYIRRKLDSETTAGQSSRRARPHLVPVLSSAVSAEAIQQRGLAYFEFFQTRWPHPAYLDSTLHLLDLAAALGSLRKDANDLYTIGTAHFMKDNKREAEKALRDAVAKNPNHARAHTALGTLLLRSDRFGEAKAAFETAVRAQPNLIEARLGLAETMLGLKEYGEAINLCNSVEERDSLSFPIVFYYKGQAYQNMSNFESARQNYARLLQLNPDMGLAILNYGDTYALEERWNEAIPWYDRLLKKDPGNIPALMNKAVSLANSGGSARAKALLNQILKLDPDFVQARSLLNELESL